MGYNKTLIFLHIDESGIQCDSKVLATVELEDIDAQKELEICRESAIRSLWLEWGVELGMSAWSSVNDFLDDMNDVVNTPREISFRMNTCDDRYFYLII